ncbi:MAG: PqiC family protein, partial [Desulfohalobiaceae bacterium]
ISFPDYADRPQIVARISDNRVKVEEFHRWAGSVKQDFSRVLVENLSQLLGSDRVFVFPWRGAVPVARRVTVDVARFDGVPGGQSTLVAHWAVIDEQGGKVLHTERTRLQQATQAHGYSGVAATLSHLTAELSRKIAARLAQEPEK